jgi:pyruvate dehydrogenase (quinone)
MEGDGLQPWQTDMDNPDFIEIAKAMGFTGIKVSEPDQVEPALKQAFTTPGPVIVSFSTDKDATPPSLF